jgi:hypothetical protein
MKQGENEVPAEPGNDSAPGGVNLPSPDVFATARRVLRIVTPGRPAFLLQKGEAGLSVFDPEAVSPPLTDLEVLGSFRPGSQIVTRSVTIIEAKGLLVAMILGDP